MLQRGVDTNNGFWFQHSYSPPDQQRVQCGLNKNALFWPLKIVLSNEIHSRLKTRIKKKRQLLSSNLLVASSCWELIVFNRPGCKSTLQFEYFIFAKGYCRSCCYEVIGKKRNFFNEQIFKLQRPQSQIYLKD